MKNITTSKIILSVCSFLIFVGGLSYSCAPDGIFSCHSYFKNIPFSVWIISCLVFLISLILLFLRSEIFKSWIKFSTLFVLVYAILIYLAPSQTSDFITPFDKKLTAWVLSFLFAIISLILIIYKSIKLRGKS